MICICWIVFHIITTSGIVYVLTFMIGDCLLLAYLDASSQAEMVGEKPNLPEVIVVITVQFKYD